jgi:hypothetical protein
VRAIAVTGRFSAAPGPRGAGDGLDPDGCAGGCAMNVLFSHTETGPH